jgi:hypothetical protein
VQLLSSAGQLVLELQAVLKIGSAFTERLLRCSEVVPMMAGAEHLFRVLRGAQLVKDPVLVWLQVSCGCVHRCRRCYRTLPGERAGAD